jgi:hypothetical protein
MRTHKTIVVDSGAFGKEGTYGFEFEPKLSILETKLEQQKHKMRNISYRKYCKKCEDFMIFDINTDTQNKICTTCGFPHDSNIDYSTVDQSKLEQQRYRYKKYESEKFKNFYSNLLNHSNIIHEILKPDNNFPQNLIIETDAGLEDIIREEKEIQSNIRKERILELERFSNIGRNDKCLCGSNLKYKKCCLDKHSKWKF